jgi:hypothetical protein
MKTTNLLMPSSGMWRRVGTFRHHLLGKEITRARKSVTLSVSYRLTFFLARVIYALKWRRHIPPKRRFLINSHEATSQKTAFFMVAAVKTYISSYPTSIPSVSFILGEKCTSPTSTSSILNNKTNSEL